MKRKYIFCFITGKCRHTAAEGCCFCCFYFTMSFASQMASLSSAGPPLKKKKRKRVENDPKGDDTLEGAPTGGPTVNVHSNAHNSNALMPVVKIYGERNTGTRYLHLLLLQNVCISPCDDLLHWKHGYPSISHIPKRSRPTSITIIITRDPNEWLHSTYARPYHMPRSTSYQSFVETPVKGDQNDPNWTPKDHPIFTDPRESNRVPLKMYQEKVSTLSTQV